MKRNPTSQRRRQTGPAVALFPFLAVLVCTMGALILMLMLIARQARLQAAEVAAAKRTAAQAEQSERLEEIRWRIEQLTAARDKTRADVAEARVQVGHLEDHSRRLRAELARLEAALADAEQQGSKDAQGRALQEAELSRLLAAVDEARRAVDQARAEAGRKPPSYAILPYVGRNGTRRRPIYIECRSDAVIIQPEGVRFGVRDFDGPLGPGNPLAAGVRAMREYWVSHRVFDPERDGEPYPLLLVRPDGVVAYYAAREALKLWETDFGYEMVGADWDLKYPDPDPALAPVIHEVVAAARSEQEGLAAAAPRTNRAPTKAKYRAAPGGGLIREDGGDEREEERYSLRSGARHFALGRGGRSDGPFPETSPVGGTPGSVGGGAGYTGSSSADVGSSGPGYAGPSGAGYGASGSGPAYAGSGSTATGDAAGGDRMFGPQFQPSTGTGGANAAGAGSTVGAQPVHGAGQAGGTPGSGTPSPTTATPEGFVAGRPPRESTSEAASGNGEPLRPGQWVPSAPEARYGEKAEPSTEPVVASRGKPRKLADARGTDWALRNAANRAVPVTRPIRVACYPDRLVIAGDGGAADRTIPLAPATERSVDAFVAALWEHMDAWGIAGRNMYWRPVLRVSTAPGAEQRLADLRSLLEGSGLDIP